MKLAGAGNWFVAGLLLQISLGLGGCSTNSATRASAFTGLMSKSREAQVGAEQHPQILEAFGGVYDDVELAGYVAEIGGRLLLNSEMPGKAFYFTLLNTPVVNAFALPGGYVYVTRGLLALANSEAELAGVLAHEIGHVTARHSAQRYSHAMVTALGASILSAVVGSNLFDQVAQLGGAAYLASFSREQEYEADLLGVRYLSRAGYDPHAEADFLDSLKSYSALAKKLAGAGGGESGWDRFFATHPQTSDRVLRAIAEAGAGPPNQKPRREAFYLGQIDGMIYGDDPAQGFVRGRQFFHPEMRITFTVPEGFRLFNSSAAVFAKGPDGAVIQFDSEPKPPQYMAMDDYLSGQWAKGASLESLERMSINGMEAATAMTRIRVEGDVMDMRLVAIRFAPDRIFRFQFATPPSLTRRLALPLRRATYSFRRLGGEEAAALRPLRLKVVKVAPGDTAYGLAAAMPFEDFRLERFQVLNALGANDPLKAGRRVKIVVE